MNPIRIQIKSEKLIYLFAYNRSNRFLQTAFNATNLFLIEYIFGD